MNYSRYIYTSEATKVFHKKELIDLLHDSRAYNTIDEICGFLFYNDGVFLQIIEGKTEAVNHLFSRIIKDSRHSNISIIIKESISEFLFEKWSMGGADLNDPELRFLPGISLELKSKENINLIISALPEISSYLFEHSEMHLL
jgi:hypothetical protein